ncbi:MULTISPECIES: hypothetical protein [Chryseobacterium]|uniref:Uncharacterized protein n=1 Tax=Chryseobacterium endophyticum TaxID=1854762 RepID=A0AAU6WSQ7_9FLAO|nr:hypothetical protein [uncultured Chryseobacterium sp.]
MINPKHPLQNYHTQQEFFLKHLAEESKEYHTLHISYGNAVYLYYQLQLNVSVDDYEEWLNEIADEEVRNTMKSKGFEACREICSFISFIQKKRNVTEDEYIRKKMGNEEYIKYKMLCQQDY